MTRSARPPLLIRILLIALLMLVIQVPPVILMLLPHYHTQGQETIIGPIIYLFVFALIIVWAWWLYRRYRRWPAQEQQPIMYVGWPVIGWLLVIVGENALARLNQAIYHQSSTANNDAIKAIMSSSHQALILMSIAAVVLSPIAEELIFRGILMNLFYKDDAYWLPILLSGLMFTLAHSSTTPISYLIYFYMGAVFAYIYRRTGRLTNTILLHALNNLLALIALLN
ncbi:CPBP family intramembrane glutamic endopeptidase [Limosilactobacillus secaliphilus]|nr:type II CAAX endopeptidase family protein [Limosilactobacillus secaliphilus]